LLVGGNAVLYASPPRQRGHWSGYVCQGDGSVVYQDGSGRGEVPIEVLLCKPVRHVLRAMWVDFLQGNEGFQPSEEISAFGFVLDAVAVECSNGDANIFNDEMWWWWGRA